jgi:hypothetical protein
MQGIMDEHHPGKKIVGWYHSHPDFGVFLSDMDMFIHRHFFNLPWQVAHVYDPIRKEEGVFVWRSGEPVIEHFAVQDDEEPVVLESPVPAKEGAARNTLPVIAGEVAYLRRKVRWLTAGIVFTLVVSMVWPVALVLISQHTPWVRELIRSVRADSADVFPTDKTERQAGAQNGSQTGQSQNGGSDKTTTSKAAPKEHDHLPAN